MTVQPKAVSKSKGVNMMLYAPGGAGKTRLIGSATGIRTLIVRPPTDHTDSIVDPSGVEEIIVHNHKELKEAFQYVQKGGHEEYDWYWLDSLSLLEDMGLDDAFAAAVERKPSRAEFGPDQGEYGINRSRIGTHVRDMVGLATDGLINFGITATVMDWRDPVNDEDIVIPFYGSPKTTMSMKLCGYMNVVAYLQVVKQEGKRARRKLVVDAPGFYGKDQFDVFPELESGLHGFVDPTMDDVLKALGKRGGAPKRTQPKRRPKTKAARKPRRR